MVRILALPLGSQREDSLCGSLSRGLGDEDNLIAFLMAAHPGAEVRDERTLQPLRRSDFR